MRFSSRVLRIDAGSNVIPIRPTTTPNVIGDDGLTAFRGLLIAATASAFFWGACLAAIWLMRARN